MRCFYLKEYKSSCINLMQTHKCQMLLKFNFLWLGSTFRSRIMTQVTEKNGLLYYPLKDTLRLASQLWLHLSSALLTLRFKGMVSHFWENTLKPFLAGEGETIDTNLTQLQVKLRLAVSYLCMLKLHTGGNSSLV